MNHTDSFLEYLKVIRRSPLTVETYRHALAAYTAFMKSRGVEVENATNADVQQFIDALKESGAAVTTRRNRAAAIRAFYRYLIQHEIVSGLWRNPARTVAIERNHPAKVSVLTDSQVERFVSFSPHTFSGIRDRAVLEVLYSTGARVSELCASDVPDLDLEGATLMIRHGKGQKQRLAYLTESAVEALTAYLPERAARVVEKDADAAHALILNRDGHRITTRGVFWAINDRVKVLRRNGVELPANIGVHTFRHSMATALYESGADIEVIQKLLGHSLLKTTLGYIHPGVEHLRRQYLAAHPHALGPINDPTAVPEVAGSKNKQ